MAYVLPDYSIEWSAISAVNFESVRQQMELQHMNGVHRPRTGIACVQAAALAVLSPTHRADMFCSVHTEQLNIACLQKKGGGNRPEILHKTASFKGFETYERS